MNKKLNSFSVDLHIGLSINSISGLAHHLLTKMLAIFKMTVYTICDLPDKHVISIFIIVNKFFHLKVNRDSIPFELFLFTHFSVHFRHKTDTTGFGIRGYFRGLWNIFITEKGV